MRVFLDFEASSLADDSYPIEVGWVFEGGEGESVLIRPAEDWNDWNPTAETIHGLSRATLTRDGVAHDVVARRMVEVLPGHDLYASAPSWDGKWLSVLLRRAGLGRKALTLRDTDEANAALVAEILTPVLDPAAIEALTPGVIRRARMEREGRIVRHRASADAEEELQVWLVVGRMARAERDKAGSLVSALPAARLAQKIANATSVQPAGADDPVIDDDAAVSAAHRDAGEHPSLDEA